ncbi:hypothetical protein EST38_g11004 [Candolleomyces aberdarensis]|uniref:Uncharacterized protein n=1 Tax=Candolleomyces aberdarensis TaxID=2316362 RepID=A0A4Q2D5Z6_9AGAR|nr:hypothetical protein EST38_g11004 [Candolleomyces aberdarensis]
MYSLNKIVLAVMVVSFLASTATSGWIMHSVLAQISAKSINIPHGTFCVPTGVSDKFYTFWIPMLAFECLLCTLALIRGFQAFVTDGSLFRAGRHLVRILLRDSVLYFLVVDCGSEVPIGFSVAMSCVLANRIILNVREINRDLELSKIPTNNQRSKGIGPAMESDIMDYYYDQAGTVSFGNHGTLTQFEMNQRPIDWQPVHIVPRPVAQEQEPDPELLESPLDDDSDVDVPHDLPFKVL